ELLSTINISAPGTTARTSPTTFSTAFSSFLVIIATVTRLASSALDRGNTTFVVDGSELSMTYPYTILTFAASCTDTDSPSSSEYSTRSPQRWWGPKGYPGRQICAREVEGVLKADQPIDLTAQSDNFNLPIAQTTLGKGHHGHALSVRANTG